MKKGEDLLLPSTSAAHGTSTTASSTTRTASASASASTENGEDGTGHVVGMMQDPVSISIPPISTNSSSQDDFISLSEYGGADWRSFENSLVVTKNPTPVTATCDSSHEPDQTVTQQLSEGHQHIDFSQPISYHHPQRKRGRYTGFHSSQPQENHPNDSKAHNKNKLGTTTTAASKPTTIRSPAALVKKNKQHCEKYTAILNSSTTSTTSFSTSEPEECKLSPYLTPEDALNYKELAIRKQEYLDKAHTSDSIIIASTIPL
ncbi:hypothetical protein Pelo_6667 [Pelomyxa schiedti]|nr:hypothetical protein Pelo_6667 [Pelomyxa schiedti]